MEENRRNIFDNIRYAFTRNNQKNMIDKLLKDNDINSIINVWDTIVPEVQSQFCDEILKRTSEISKVDIDTSKIDPKIQVWLKTHDSVQIEKLDNVLNYTNNRTVEINEVWKYTSPVVQQELFSRVMDFGGNENPLVYLRDIWIGTADEVKTNNQEVFFKIIQKIGQGRAVADVLNYTPAEIKQNNIVKIIKCLENDPENLSSIWGEMPKEIQTSSFDRCVEFLGNNKGAIGNLWMSTDPDVQKEHSDSLSKIMQNHRSDIWEKTDKSIQFENRQLLYNLISMYSDVDYSGELWRGTNSDLQRGLFDKVINIIDKPDLDETKKSKFKIKIWSGTDEIIQNEKINFFNELISNIKKTDNTRGLSEVWKNTNSDLQSNKFEEVFNLFKENRLSLWEGSKSVVQNEKFMTIFKSLAKNPNLLNEYWACTNDNIKREKFGDTLELLNLDDSVKGKIQKIYSKNDNLIHTLNMKFATEKDLFELYTDEQLVRITNYPNIQEYILKCKDNPVMQKGIDYLMRNDTNWIISLNKIMKNDSFYSYLQINLNNMDKSEITDDFIQRYLSVISDNGNYFNILNVNDINEYTEKRSSMCLDILQGNTKDVKDLNLDSADDVYKFALLEYKFGIDLNEAKRLVSRYGADVDKLPDNTDTRFLKVIKDVIECENIEKIINNTVNNNQLGEPWGDFPNVRNVEGNIINIFSELYNDTLYQPEVKDKREKSEIYLDNNGLKHSIDVYDVKKDFNINIRVEGAYVSGGWIPPENFVDYYETPNLDYHGNCESYIGNDSIASARNIGRVAVGYSQIRKNSLISSGPYDLFSCSDNVKFYSYDANSEFRTPEEMINNTRHTHNEMVKDRIVIDENGNVSKYKPDYAVWIEETSMDERTNPEWEKRREKDSQWNMTKKLAADLGIPIVVIDREYFANREYDKIELMKKLILDEKINENLYYEYLPEYENLSKPELLEKLIVKYENNKVGLMCSNVLKEKYFSDERLENIIGEIDKSIKNLDSKEYKECVQALAHVSNNETRKGNNNSNNINFYGKMHEKYNDILYSLEPEKEFEFDRSSNDKVSNNLLESYLDLGIENNDLRLEKESLARDKENDRNNSKEEMQL
ncbi:MAG: hypothetical protein IKG42_00565 [Clostridia bacterium]|nr:hypothetical protein [Clostridia bacterium]